MRGRNFIQMRLTPLAIKHPPYPQVQEIILVFLNQPFIGKAKVYVAAYYDMV